MFLAPVLFSVLLVANASDWVKEWASRIEPLCQGNPKCARKALPLLDEMAKEAKKRKDVEMELYARWRRGCCERHVGDFAPARKTLEAALKIAPEGSFLRFNIQRDLGEFCLRDGDWLMAKRHFGSALALACACRQAPVLRGMKTPIPAIALTRLELLNAQCLNALFQTAKAQEAVLPIAAKIAAEAEKARQNGKPLSDGWDYLRLECESCRAELDMQNSNPVQAVKRLRWCLTEAQGLKSRQSFLIQFGCRQVLAEIYRKLARFDDADAQLDQAAEILPSDLQTVLTSADLLGARATLQLEKVAFAFAPEGAPDVLKQLAEAERLALKALEALKKPAVFKASKVFEIAQIHELRGRIHAFAGEKMKARREIDLARRRYDEAIRLVSPNPLPPEHDVVLQFRRCRARLLLRQEELSAAKKEANEIFKLFAENHGKTDVDRGDFHHLLLEVAFRDHHLENAASHAAAHRKLSAEHQTAYLARLTAPEQIKYFRMHDDPGLHASLRLGVHDKTLHDSSAEWLINGKAKIAEVTAHVHQHERNGETHREFQRSVQRQAYLLHGGLGGDEKTLEKEFLLEEGKKRDLAEKRTVKLPDRWYTLSDLRKGLSRGEAYIDVFCLRPQEDAPRAYYAWVVVGEKPASVVKLGDADKIDELVKKFVDHHRPANFQQLTNDVGLREAEKTLHADCLLPLSRLIFAPLCRLAQGSDRWTVSPDGPLWNLPWGALLMPGTDKYAVEKIRFRYVISGRDLARPAANAVQTGEPWVLADPDLDSLPAGEGWRRRGRKDRLLVGQLEGAREEGREVADCLKQFFKVNPSVQERRTTKDALLALTMPPRIVYLATHGFSPLPTKKASIDDPLLSCGIAFAGFNRLPAGMKKTPQSLPGLLTGAEVVTANLLGTELVVLSACKSGTGVTQYGQSPADLRHAFHLAGDRAVVSSLWNVDDKHTRELMVHFAKAYSKAGASDKAFTLNEAQRQMIVELRKGRQEHSHPFFWAAFTLSGS